MKEFFSINYRVPYADTDKMGVVYYSNYLVFFERGRNELLRAGNVLYSQLEQEHIMLPVISAHCDYKSPAFYDDLLTIKVWIPTLKGCRMTFEYEIATREKIIVTGYTIHASICAKKRKPVSMPKSLVDLYKFKTYLG